MHTIEKKSNRLPTYGINLLKNSDDLSTDLFQSMLAYAGMAHTNEAMNNIVNTLEVGSNVLKKRIVEGIEESSERKKRTSNSYIRYQKYLEKQVYGVGQKRYEITNGILLNKITKALTKLGGILYLGGNVAGGTVNLLQGIAEITKEAIGDEFFGLTNFKKC